MVFAFPLAFLLSVVLTALFELVQVGGAGMTLFLGGGLLLVLLVDRFAGRAAGFLVCLTWSPVEVLDWIGRGPFPSARARQQISDRAPSLRSS